MQGEYRIQILPVANSFMFIGASTDILFIIKVNNFSSTLFVSLAHVLKLRYLK